MKTPLVTFVVPCYKLAHLLGECVQSILDQTYTDFEILIMDDCSPDNTPEVAQSFGDERVKHIRNHSNLGHLRNYNKGIELAQGKYIWLISADDYLRRPYVLERSVEVMERNPRVGYTFCPGVGVRDGQETEVLGYSIFGGPDRVVNGHVLLKRLVDSNIVLAASALVRRECYEKVGAFPLKGEWAGTTVDFGWNGDWYLWCMFALYFEVAYFAEPMVCYREHDLAMSNFFTNQENVRKCLDADIGMLWLVRQEAVKARMPNAAKLCLAGIANEYARHVASKQYRLSASSMTVDEFEQSLCRSTQNPSERKAIRSRSLVGMGDRLRLQGDLRSARSYYVRAFREDPGAMKAYIELVLLSLGRTGNYLHKAVRRLRSVATAQFAGRW
jgi:glycosyltransferase involved in cell wall biosynthesis